MDAVEVIGRVIFISGKAYAVNAKGERRELLLNDDVFISDTLYIEQSGVVHISFFDGREVGFESGEYHRIVTYFDTTDLEAIGLDASQLESLLSEADAFNPNPFGPPAAGREESGSDAIGSGSESQAEVTELPDSTGQSSRFYTGLTGVRGNPQAGFETQGVSESFTEDDEDVVDTVDGGFPAAPTVDSLITNDIAPLLSGTADLAQGDTLTVSVNGVIYAQENGVVYSPANNTWTLQIPSSSPLPEGRYEVTVTITDIAGNQASDQSSVELVIDLTAPTSVGVNPISSEQDTGRSDSDGITNNNQLIFTGSAEPGNTVEVFLDGNAIGIVTADAAGNWSLDYTGTTLPDNDYQLTANATDAAGNSTGSSAYEFTVDTSSSVSITDIGEDTGSLNSDGITRDNQLIFNGNAEPGSSVEVFLDGNSIGTVVADAGGSWSLDYSNTALPDKAYQLTATTTDSAGNTSSSTVYDFTVDTTTSVSIDSISDDTGNSNSDGVTRDNQLIFNGNAEPGSSVEVFLDGNAIGVVTANANGNWSLDYSDVTLPDGDYVLTAITTDISGNAGDAQPYDFTVKANNSPGNVSIRGIAEEDQTLVAIVTDSDGLPLHPNDISYQWQRLENGVWRDISNATGSTYALGDSDVGFQVRVSVSYNDSPGFDEGPISSPSTPIANINDAPVFGGDAAGRVTEKAGDPTLSDTGTLTISDADTGEASFQTTGITASAGALGSLSITSAGVWTYNVENADVQYLAKDETKVETFTVKSTDGTDHDIVVTITGAEDPTSVTVTAADTAVTEDDAGNNTANGTVSVTDVDSGEGTLATSTATYGTVTVDGSGNWTYTLNHGLAAVQALDDGVTLTDTITFTSDTGVTETLTVTITGSNDAATITASTSEDTSVREAGDGVTGDASAGGTLS
ncbi:MAG: Ig-like domain-containing protein, partial [Endozoicomonas sp.]